jgi:PIN domain nuclease of toxin-antitoxin system
VKILLDTQVWLWMNAEPERLSSRGKRIIGDLRHELFLSAASVWEIAIKYSIGKLALPEDPAVYVPSRLALTRIAPLAIQHTHACRVAALPKHHSDPFDRLLIAQAELERLTTMTADEQFDEYGIEIIRP